jgi:hypothetical protein
METIEVVYKETGVPGTYHKYILYTDSSGNVSYARGGPSMGQFGVFGSINTQYGLYVDDPDILDYIRPLDDNRHRETVASSENLSVEWNAILTAMDDLDNQYLYSPTAQNSNTTVDWALLYAGLPLPEDDGYGEYFCPASISSPDNPPAMIPFLPAVIINSLPSLLLPVVGMQDSRGTVITGGGGGWYCPLILDLDGDGAHSVNLGWVENRSRVYFDMDNDGYAERTAWVAAGDGLLAIDKNGNGKIDGQGELFGNGVGFADGFASLKQYDGNADNKITAADAANDNCGWRKSRVA